MNSNDSTLSAFIGQTPSGWDRLRPRLARVGVLCISAGTAMAVAAFLGLLGGEQLEGVPALSWGMWAALALVLAMWVLGPSPQEREADQTNRGAEAFGYSRRICGAAAVLAVAAWFTSAQVVPAEMFAAAMQDEEVWWHALETQPVVYWAGHCLIGAGGLLLTATGVNHPALSEREVPVRYHGLRNATAWFGIGALIAGIATTGVADVLLRSGSPDPAPPTWTMWLVWPVLGLLALLWVGSRTAGHAGAAALYMSATSAVERVLAAATAAIALFLCHRGFPTHYLWGDPAQSTTGAASYVSLVQSFALLTVATGALLVILADPPARKRRFHVAPLAAPAAALLLAASLVIPAADGVRNRVSSSTAPSSGAQAEVPATVTEAAWSFKVPEDFTEGFGSDVSSTAYGVLLIAGHGVAALDTDSGEEVWSYRRPETGVRSLVTPDRERVVLGFTSREADGQVVNQVLTLDADTGEPVSGPINVPGSRRPAQEAAPEEDPPNSWLADATKRAWLSLPPDPSEPLQGFDLATGERLWDFTPPEGCAAVSAATVQNGFLLPVTCEQDESEATHVLALDDSSGEELWSLELTHTASEIDVSADGGVAQAREMPQVRESVADPEAEVTLLDAEDGTVLNSDIPGFEGQHATWHNLDEISESGHWEVLQGDVHTAAPENERTILSVHARHGEPVLTYQQLSLTGGEQRTAEFDLAGGAFTSHEDTGFEYMDYRIGPAVALDDAAVGVLSGDSHDADTGARVVVAPWDSNAQPEEIDLDDEGPEGGDLDCRISNMQEAMTTVAAPGAVVLSPCKIDDEDHLIGLQ